MAIFAAIFFMQSKFIIISCLTLLLARPMYAQYHELGLFAGGSNFAGDVGANVPDLPRGYAGGLFYRLNFNRHWALRTQFNYGFIQASDKYATNFFRQDRNFSFQSEIWEGNLMFEFNFLEYEPGTKLNHTPYLLGGVGLFWFEPKTEYQGELVKLQPLGTEGQGTSLSDQQPYGTASSFFGFGMGYKFALSKKFSMGLEITFRQTNTDYLDDVSGRYVDPVLLAEENGTLAGALSNRRVNPQAWVDRPRGDASANDWYIFTGLTMHYKLDSFYEKCARFF